MRQPLTHRGRIESESEPPDLATETNADHSTFWALNPPSLVRMRQSLAAKTPRNRGDFSGCARVRAGSLCNCRLGGGASRIRTLSTLWRINSESEPRDLATKKFELAVQISRVPPLTEANRKRIRTAQLGDRDKRGSHGLRRHPRPEPAVSGSGSRGPYPKTPRNRGDFSGCARVRAESLCNCRRNGGESGIRTQVRVNTRLTPLDERPL